jgi:hypothetical protein
MVGCRGDGGPTWGWCLVCRRPENQNKEGGGVCVHLPAKPEGRRGGTEFRWGRRTKETWVAAEKISRVFI